MQELLSVVAHNTNVTRQHAIKLLSVLHTWEDKTISLQYNQVMRELSDFLPVWMEHRRLLSQVYPLVSRGNGMTFAVLRQLEEGAADTASSLEVTRLAGWARTPALGIVALRLRATTTLRDILCQLETERTTLLPLLRRCAVKTVEPTPLTLMATA